MFSKTWITSVKSTFAEAFESLVMLSCFVVDWLLSMFLAVVDSTVTFGSVGEEETSRNAVEVALTAANTLLTPAHRKNIAKWSLFPCLSI